VELERWIAREHSNPISEKGGLESFFNTKGKNVE
jgi:hypothetical protein